MKKEISVVIKRPGENPEMKRIPNTLKSLQSIVGGLIQVFPVASDLLIICNENGRLLDMPYNFSIQKGGHFVGPVIFCGAKGEDFLDIPVSFETFKKIFKNLWKESEK